MTDVALSRVPSSVKFRYMAVTTIDRTKHTLFWQITLGSAGLLAVAAAATLEVVILMYHSTSKVIKNGSTTSTIAGPAAPTATLVTTCLGVGVLLILAAAFFSRISKLAIAGVGEVDLDAAAAIAGKAAAKAGGDPGKTATIYKAAASRAAEIVAQRTPVPARMSAVAPARWPVAPPLDDNELQELVDKAADNMGNS
jgi:hypothetical protein